VSAASAVPLIGRSVLDVAAQQPMTTSPHYYANWDDRLPAEYMASLATITLQALSDIDRHNVIIWVVKNTRACSIG
jgi:hypothetical protein